MGLMKELLAGVADILSRVIHVPAFAAHSGHDLQFLLAVASKFLGGCTIASALSNANLVTISAGSGLSSGDADRPGRVDDQSPEMYIAVMAIELRRMRFLPGYSLVTRPLSPISWRGISKRYNGPRSATTVTAVSCTTPRNG
jgi:hypothetical protein